MQVGSKWGGHRCFCTTVEENICSFNVTWRGGGGIVARGVSSVLSQPHRDKMLQQADSRPSQNNSRKCQTSDHEMRPWEVSSTFCGPPHPPNYPPTSTWIQPEWGQATKTPQKNNNTLLCIHVDGCVLLLAQYLLCMVTNRPPEKDTIQPQNSLWLTQP